jgi:hypothetical protein
VGHEALDGHYDRGHPVGVLGYTPLRLPSAGMGTASPSAVPGQSLSHSQMRPVRHSPPSHAPLFPGNSGLRASRISEPTPSTSSSPAPSLSPLVRHRPPLCKANKEQANKRRREQRAHERPFFKEMISAHAEQTQP